MCVSVCGPYLLSLGRHGESGPELGVFRVKSLVVLIHLAASGEMVSVAPEARGHGSGDGSNGDVLGDEGESRAGGQDPHVPHVVEHAVVYVDVDGVREASLREQGHFVGRILGNRLYARVHSLRLHCLAEGNEAVELQTRYRKKRHWRLLSCQILLHDAFSQKSVPPVIKVQYAPSQVRVRLHPPRGAVATQILRKLGLRLDVCLLR